MFDRGVRTVMKNQMKFVYDNGKMKHQEGVFCFGTNVYGENKQKAFLAEHQNFQLIDFQNLSPVPVLPLSGYGYGYANNEVAVSIEGLSFEEVSLSKINKKNFLIIDGHGIRKGIKKVLHQWFPFGNRNTSLAVGVFWTAFMTYIFPWLLDIAKVYCAWKVVQGFYSEGKGLGKEGGRSGFGSLVYYGKWYLAFWLVPWGVELIDEIGRQMNYELIHHPIDLKQQMKNS